MSHRLRASCTIAAASRTPLSSVSTVRENARGLDLLLFGTPSTGVVDLEAITADSRIAAARGGTLFLEDVGELPASVQARLARLVRDGEASIDGQPVTVSFRLLGSATPGIGGDVDARRFRLDLVSPPVRLAGSTCRRCAIGRKTCRLWRFARSTICGIAEAHGPSQFHAGGAGAPVGVDLARQSRRATSRHRASCRRRAERGDPDRASAAGACSSTARRPPSCPRATSKRRGCDSSATTSRRSSSTTAGRWRMPPRRWAFSARTCTGKRANWASP